MLEKILPKKVLAGLKNVGEERVEEIRLRAGGKAVVLTHGKRAFLSEMGLSEAENTALIVSKEELDELIFRACDGCFYAFEEFVKNGFLPVEGGIRIGLCGTGVCEGKRVKTIRDVTSVNIRIPHRAAEAAKTVAKLILNPLSSVLIVSPPGGGKTTLLRELIFCLPHLCNALVADERMELCSNGAFSMYQADVFSGTEKSFVFDVAIRTMNPDVIITDELAPEDFSNAKRVMESGVKLFASWHARSIAEVKENVAALECGFDFFVHLSTRHGAGTLEGIYDNGFRRLDV